MPSCTITIEVITKIITVCVSLLIAIISIINVATVGGFSLSVLIMSIYYILFSIVLILAEFRLMFLFKKFRLMRYHLGKSIYCVIIGLLMIQQNHFGLTMVCAVTLFGLGIYHLVLMFICKKKEQQVEEKVSQNSSRTAPLNTP